LKAWLEKLLAEAFSQAARDQPPARPAVIATGPGDAMAKTLGKPLENYGKTLGKTSTSMVEFASPC
jgi:hypothetical protein